MDAPKLIFVCSTCDRNRARADGERSAGAALADDIRNYLKSNERSGRWQVRGVGCLTGCLRPCSAAFRGPGRFTYRFSQVVGADAAAIVQFGAHYWHSDEGRVSDDRIPAVLRPKMTLCTPPGGRWQ